MKHVLSCLLLLPFCVFSQVSIIPAPQYIEFKNGVFNFQKGLTIQVDNDDKALAPVVQLFRQGLFQSNNYKEESTGKKIILHLTGPKRVPEDESYSLHITSDSIIISADSYHGLFYGCQSAIQLLHQNSASEIACMEITDNPQFKHRGLELDVCRHFYSKEVIKQYLELMAQLKMNVFHWHLTDDQGWRIEIKKYPRLTDVGAWRTEKDGTRYGGFYTQDDIREIVAYAQERFITVVPEIELPGHSSAAIAAYPFLSCNPDLPKTIPVTWGIKNDIYSPGDSTFIFLREVLDEVCALFPGKYIHLGGDEAPKDAWKKSSTAQAIIKRENLKNEEELQHYFLKKTEDYLATKGKRCLGWGEIVKGGLSDSVVVMSWLNKKAGVKALKHGNAVIMTPRTYCYFDYPQTIADKKHAWWMLYLTIRKVYKFNPLPANLTTGKRALVFGGQANVWTEYITDAKQLKHQIMPRLAAMAEALWSKKKNFEDFKKRLNKTTFGAPLAVAQ